MKQVKKQVSNKTMKYQKPAIEKHGKITDMVLAYNSDAPAPARPQID